MTACVTCSSVDGYDRVINGHNERYSVMLDPNHARIEVYDMKPTPEMLLTDVLVRYCPICGRELGVEVDE